MLAEVAVGREKERSAVQGAALSLDDADHQVQRVFGCDRGKPVDRRPWNID